MKEKIILLGGGGHAKSVIDSIKNQDKYDIVGILDLEHKVGTRLLGVPIIGVDNDLKKYYDNEIRSAFVTLGSLGNPKHRIKLYETARKIGYVFPNIIDSSATVASTALLGEGCYVGKGVIINSDANIGINCILNTGCVVEHDCKIDNFVHLAPRSVICGETFVGEGTHIGVNTTVIQGIHIGRNSIVGAGSVVLKNIADSKKAYGNPCKEVGRFE